MTVPNAGELSEHGSKLNYDCVQLRFQHKAVAYAVSCRKLMLSVGIMRYDGLRVRLGSHCMTFLGTMLNYEETAVRKSTPIAHGSSVSEKVRDVAFLGSNT